MEKIFVCEKCGWAGEPKEDKFCLECGSEINVQKQREFKKSVSEDEDQLKMDWTRL